eukprot:435351-Rhodomonas_salina.2
MKRCTDGLLLGVIVWKLRTKSVPGTIESTDGWPGTTRRTTTPLETYSRQRWAINRRRVLWDQPMRCPEFQPTLMSMPVMSAPAAKSRRSAPGTNLPRIRVVQIYPETT